MTGSRLSILQPSPYSNGYDPKNGNGGPLIARKARPRVPNIMVVMRNLKKEKQPPLSLVDRVKVWMINEGARRLFVVVFVILHLMVFAFGFMNYKLKDTMDGPNSVFGITYPIARAAALTLHVDVAFLLLPVCRTVISYARQTHLNGVIEFDKNITLHKLIGWSIFFFSWLHTIAHWNNFIQFARKKKLSAREFFALHATTGPGWTGYIMLIALNVMVFTSIGRNRKKNFEMFWYTHHLFIVFFLFWSFHGAFCMIKPDYPPFCAGIGVFWQYWLLGGFLYLGERIAREVRGGHETYISKVIQHPNKVVEIQFHKEHTTTRAGQYVFICCPAVSVWQYHPFTLTSAPEEGFLSVHVRCVGDFTNAFAKAVGCRFDKKAVPATQKTGEDLYSGLDNSDPLQRILPRIFIDGPFGSASEDVFKFETAVLVGGGIGVTPFASILKSIWYRMNYSPGKTRLRKVYFIWVSSDFSSFEWFRGLLDAIEEQDENNQIELLIHTTMKANPSDVSNISLHSEMDCDTITGLQTQTNFGRPRWDQIFPAIKKIHSPGQAGVFFCGPKPLGSVLHAKCNQYSDAQFGFVWGKENF